MSTADQAAEPRAQRFFFALRPDARAATALAGLAMQLAGQTGGRPLAAHDLHLTLVFVGARDAAETDRLAGLLDGLLDSPLPAAALPALPSLAPVAEFPPFTLSQLGAFGPRLLWIGPPQPVPWVEALSHGLRRRLAAAGIGYDERPLRAHVTLLRGARHALSARGAVAPIEPAGWRLCLGWSGLASMPQRRYDWRCHHTVKLTS